MSPTLRTIAGIFSERWRTASTCEACGNEFVCGAKLSGCWCSEIKLSDEQRVQLRSQYSGCLCRACLSETENAQKEKQIPNR